MAKKAFYNKNSECAEVTYDPFKGGYSLLPNSLNQRVKKYSMTNAFETVPLVFSCCDMIGSAISSVPMYFYMYTKKGESKLKNLRITRESIQYKNIKTDSGILQGVSSDWLVERTKAMKEYEREGLVVKISGEHPLYKLLNPPLPNVIQSFSNLIYLTLVTSLNYGEHFWLYEFKGKTPINIHTSTGLTMAPRILERGATEELVGWQQRVTTGSGKQYDVTWKNENLLQHKLPNIMNKYRGLPPMKAGRLTIEQFLNIAIWNAGLFKEGVRPPIVIETDQAIAGAQYKEWISNIVSKFSGFLRGHHPLTLTRGAKAKVLFNEREVDFLKSLELTKEEICCVPETKIVCRGGLKQIKDVKVGDFVLTHAGRFKKVIKTMNREVDENLKGISTGTLDTLIVTKNHPIQSFNVRKTSLRYEIIGDFSWKKAEDFITYNTKGLGSVFDFVTLPKPIKAIFFELEKTLDDTIINALNWHEKQTQDYFLYGVQRCGDYKYKGKVYNLEVENDNSYVTTGGTVHNCSLLHIPPAMVGIFRWANYANAKIQKEVFWELGNIPRMIWLQENIQTGLLDPYFPDVFAEWDYEFIKALRDDPIQDSETKRNIAQAANIYWNMGYDYKEIAEVLGEPLLIKTGSNTSTQTEEEDSNFLTLDVVNIDKTINTDTNETTYKASDGYFEAYSRNYIKYILEPNVNSLIKYYRQFVEESINNLVNQVKKEGITIPLNSLEWSIEWEKLSHSIIEKVFNKGVSTVQTEVMNPEKALIKMASSKSSYFDDLFDDEQEKELQNLIIDLNKRNVFVQEIINRLNTITLAFNSNKSQKEILELLEQTREKLLTNVSLPQARSVVGYAYNTGRQIAMNRFNVKKHIWITSKNAKRDNHIKANKQEALLGSKFKHVDMRFPYDPASPLSNTINCQCCTIVSIVQNNNGVVHLLN